MTALASSKTAVSLPATASSPSSRPELFSPEPYVHAPHKLTEATVIYRCKVSNGSSRTPCASVSVSAADPGLDGRGSVAGHEPHTTGRGSSPGKPKVPRLLPGADVSPVQLVSEVRKGAVMEKVVDLGINTRSLYIEDVERKARK